MISKKKKTSEYKKKIIFEISTWSFLNFGEDKWVVGTRADVPWMKTAGKAVTYHTNYIRDSK